MKNMTSWLVLCSPPINKNSHPKSPKHNFNLVDEETLNPINVCLSSTFFSYKGIIYEQIEGTTMCSSLYPRLWRIYLWNISKPKAQTHGISSPNAGLNLLTTLSLYGSMTFKPSIPFSTISIAFHPIFNSLWKCNLISLFLFLMFLSPDFLMAPSPTNFTRKGPILAAIFALILTSTLPKNQGFLRSLSSAPLKSLIPSSFP